jgi:hypothetical protein
MYMDFLPATTPPRTITAPLGSRKHLGLEKNCNFDTTSRSSQEDDRPIANYRSKALRSMSKTSVDRS